MNYRKIYKQLMVSAKSRMRQKYKGEYFEEHHIMPEFMFKHRKRKGPSGTLGGNPDDKNNLVLLTAREHFIAHMLLYKIYKGTPYEYQCGSAMCVYFRNPISNNREEICDSKKYERYRMIAKECISKQRAGTMPVVDKKTGIACGSVSLTHPKVLSGEWVHHSKGKHKYYNSITGEGLFCKTNDPRLYTETGWVPAKSDNSGEKNNRYSGITNEDIYSEYLSLTLKLGALPSFPFFRKVYYLKHNKELPKHFSKYRFNNGKELISKVEQETGYTFEKYQKWTTNLNPMDYINDKNKED